MSVSGAIHTADVWAAGGPHRIVIGGLPPIKGRTLNEKQEYIRQRLPQLPRVLTRAPDDPKGMVAAILTEPCNVQADLGVIWMGCGEFMNMCGTGTFAIGTVLSELGMIPNDSGRFNKVMLETPGGIQQITIELEAERASKVSTRTSPAYFYGDYQVQVPGHGDVYMELAYGINCLEPLVDCTRLGIDLIEKNQVSLAALGQKIALAIVATGEVDIGPTAGRQLSFYQDNPANSDASFRCMAIVGNGEVDTTPSGTSTCAQLAARFAKAQIHVGDELIVESITGATLSGRVVEETEFEGRKAVIPEIRGSGRIIRYEIINF